MAEAKNILICVVIVISALGETWFFYQRVEPSRPLLGYNLLLRENVLTSQQICRAAEKLREVGCQIVKVWIPVNSLHPKVLENGGYGDWDFTFWDSVLEPLAKENLLIILDPWFRSTQEFCPPDLTEEMLVKRRWGSVNFPSVFHPRVREYMKTACEAIAAHYSKERPDIGKQIKALVLFNEPYFFTLGAIEWSKWKGFRLPLFLLIDEDSTHISQDFWIQVENLALFVRELRETIKRRWEVGIMLCYDVMWVSWPPSAAMYERLARETDYIGIDPYPGNYWPVEWFGLEFILKRTLNLGKPVWITEWGYNATDWMGGRRRIPDANFAKEFIKRCSRKGVQGIIYFNFFEPWGKEPGIYSVYDPATGEIMPDARELCQVLKELAS
jgi:hypothetical protein